MSFDDALRETCRTGDLDAFKLRSTRVKKSDLGDLLSLASMLCPEPVVDSFLSAVLDRGCPIDDAVLYDVLKKGSDETLARVLEGGGNARAVIPERGPMINQALRPTQLALMLRFGANPNAVSRKTTALMRQCSKGTKEGIALLLVAGADLRRKNEKNQTALDIARARDTLKDDPEVIAWLSGKAKPSRPMAERSERAQPKPYAAEKVAAFEKKHKLRLPDELTRLLTRTGPMSVGALKIDLPDAKALARCRKKFSARAGAKQVAGSEGRGELAGTYGIGTRGADDVEYVLVMNGPHAGSVWEDLYGYFGEMNLRRVGTLSSVVAKALRGELSD